MSLRTIFSVVSSLLGGGLIGFNLGLGFMNNMVMGGLGLLEGGTPSWVDMDTAYYVADIMMSVSRRYGVFQNVSTLTIVGFALIISGILVASLPELSRLRERLEL